MDLIPITGIKNGRVKNHFVFQSSEIEIHSYLCFDRLSKRRRINHK